MLTALWVLFYSACLVGKGCDHTPPQRFVTKRECEQNVPLRRIALEELGWHVTMIECDKVGKPEKENGYDAR